jgi:cobalt-zinc-cadmium efflux system protein
MTHHHSHSEHSHGHDHVPTNFGRSFLIAAGGNTIFILAEVIYGIKANSLALLADAGHNFSDVISLLLAWGAWCLSKRAPTSHYTYGLRSTSILASLVNAIILLVTIGGISWEAVKRFHTAEAVAGNIVMWVAAFGIVVNGATACLFNKGQDDLNIKAAFLHLAGDAAISAGVVAAGFVIYRTGWIWLDPTVSLAVSAVIIWGTWGLLRDSVNLALQGVPASVDLKKVKDYLLSLPGVQEVHDLHIWAMSTTETALSAHLLMGNRNSGDGFLKKMAHDLEHDFRIGHTTIQIEVGDTEDTCKLAPDHVV